MWAEMKMNTNILIMCGLHLRACMGKTHIYEKRVLLCRQTSPAMIIMMVVCKMENSQRRKENQFNNMLKFSTCGKVTHVCLLYFI